MTVAITASAFPVMESNEINDHLDEFSAYTVTHHDNIDDAIDAHSHTHKHSEDGEEHEHNHDHSKGFVSVAKTIAATLSHKLFLPESETSVGFSNDRLVSDPHAFGIFRPPIA